MITFGPDLELLTKYKATILFLVKFFSIYILGNILYSQYLASFDNQIDIFTLEVAREAKFLLGFEFDGLKLIPVETSPVVDIYYSGFALVRVIEGCNSISIFILFLAFVIAFKGKLKHYLWYIPTGLIFLHLVNVFRISLVGYIYFHFNSFTHTFHDYIFPAIIYGSVMLLWIIWVKFLVHE